MTFKDLAVGQKFRVRNLTSGLVDYTQPPYTKVVPGNYKPGQPYNTTYPYGRKLARTAYIFIPEDHEILPE